MPSAEWNRPAVALAVLLVCSVPASAQAPFRYQASWADGASVGAGAMAYVLPGLLGLPSGGPSCNPCDPASLPAIDRWALRPVSPVLEAASGLALATVAGFTAVQSLHGLPSAPWRGNLAVLANSATWTAASAQWLKVLIHRNRPALYTGAPGAAQDPANRESLPSGHAALAFAAATTYWVIAERERLPHRARNTVLLYGGAFAVSALRVAAGKHFPTDVAASAGLGFSIGWLAGHVHPGRR